MSLLKKRRRPKNDVAVCPKHREPCCCVTVAQAEAYATERLVCVGCLFPVDDVNQLPGIADKIPLQLALLIDHQLSFRIQDAGALRLIRVIQVEFSDCQVVGAGSGVPLNFTEAEEAVGNKSNLAAGRSWSHLGITYVVADRAGDGDVADGTHFG